MATVALSLSFWIFLFLSTLLDQKRDGERGGGRVGYLISRQHFARSPCGPQRSMTAHSVGSAPHFPLESGNPRRRRRRSICLIRSILFLHPNSSAAPLDGSARHSVVQSCWKMDQIIGVNDQAKLSITSNRVIVYNVN